jgi:serine/threonine protein kinase
MLFRNAIACVTLLGVVHRDIKPSNIICKSNIEIETPQPILHEGLGLECVLGDFSSAYDDYTRDNLYTRGPSSLEQSNEYAPPEAIFGYVYNDTSVGLSSSFDSWSIGIVCLEILLGTPKVFSVDQRTR